MPPPVDVRHRAHVDGAGQLGDRPGVDRRRLEHGVGDGRAGELGRRVAEPGARALDSFRTSEKPFE